VASETFPLANGAVRVIDIAELIRNSPFGVQQQGVAVAYLLGSGVLAGFPIHYKRALQGSFTVANLATGSAWGSPALGRSVRQVINPTREPDNGALVDGQGVIYQRIQPTSLVLATYYRPETLAPVEDAGNQLISVSFRDGIGIGIGAGAPLIAATTNWGVIVTRGADGELLGTQLSVTGVDDTDLVSVFGTDINGAAGVRKPGGIAFDQEGNLFVNSQRGDLGSNLSAVVKFTAGTIGNRAGAGVVPADVVISRATSNPGFGGLAFER